MENLKKKTIENGLVTYNLEPEKKETTSGLFVSAGEISEDYDKVEWKELLEDYTHMRNGGAVESTTISILKYPILKAGYTIVHDNPKIVDYCNWCFENLVDSFGDKDGFSEFQTHLFLALDFGCSFFEKVYENGVFTPEKKITNIIKRLSPFKAETIFEFHYNTLMQFAGIRHERREANSMNTFIDIAAEKLFFYAHNTEYGDPRGRSELRPVRNLYKIKKDILLATARSQQRGAGIPEIKINKSGATAQDMEKAKTVGRTIGAMKSGYVITDSDITITLHSLSSLSSPEAMLEFINREMFFNTLSEFMTSGIGQSGSRSATSEHKSSFELKCGVVTAAVEKKMNLLLREIMDISYLAPVEKYPTFRFNALQQTDIVSASDSIIKFYDKSILTKQDGDEDFIRGLFNMPEKIIVKSKEVIEPSNTENEEEVSTVKKTFSQKKFMRILSADEQLDFIQKTFDVEAVENLYLNMQKEAGEIIQEVTSKYVMYIAKQVESGKPVEIKYDVELANRLNKLFRSGYSVGASSVLSEIEKASGKKFDSNTSTEDVRKGISQSLTRYAGRLIYNIKTVVEDKLETEWIRDKKSAVDYVIEESFENGFKTDKRTLIEKTTDGYLIGRGEILNENKEKIELYFYNSILDSRLCDNCAIMTGAVITLEEAQSLGLITGKGRVNPNCLGSINSCRCILMPYKIKGDFTI